MSRILHATRYYAQATFEMLDEECRDFLIMQLATGKVEDYEPPLSEFIVRFACLQQDSGWCFLDIGANTGLHSLAAASSSATVKCVAFEPVPAIFDVLLQNISRNPEIQDRVDAKNVGLVAAGGRITFYETLNDAGFISTSSSFTPPGTGVPLARRYEIEALALDDLQFAEKVRLIKIDVGGYELPVITGGLGLIARARPTITLTILDRNRGRDLNELAQSLNYIFFSVSSGLFNMSEQFVSGTVANYILCPREKAIDVYAIMTDMGLHRQR
jgi:FkbM family methyltransferase